MHRRQFAFAGVISAGSLFVGSRSADATPTVAGSRVYRDDIASALLTQIRQAESVTAGFGAWSSIVRPILPFAHLTALVCRAPDAAGAVGEPQIGDVQRVFSTIPTAYPVGGWKHLTGSDWARYVLIDQRTLIASGHERLMHFFPDYALLESLGVRTLVNIPVVVCRRTVGAFALLLETPTVDQDALAQVEAIALLMSGVFTLGQGASR